MRPNLVNEREGWQLAPVRQILSDQHIEDVPAEVRRGLHALPLAERLRPGMRVAVAVGSRGIGCLLAVVETLITELKACGTQPFLVPAMGSHGGGTAEGQRQVLEGYGLSAERLGIPVISSLETVEVGRTPAGMPVYCDAHAASADGVVLINRIKEHTAFKARWESGLLKLLAVGLGKPKGAAEIHNWGLPEAMHAAGQVGLERLPVLFGIAIVENGFHQPARIAVLPRERIEAEEPALLDLARSLLPKIPLEPLDLLVIQEMGKDLSGTGMDLNVIGMWRRTGGPVSPRFKTIAVLDLTANSHGNAIGVGHADLIPQRLYDKIDLAATYKNCLTSHNLAGGKIPIVLPNDAQVLAAGLAGLGHERARWVWVQNTLALDRLWVSPALLPEVERCQGLVLEGPLQSLVFDDQENLVPPVVEAQNFAPHR